jgi:hypothetical protein
VAFSAKWGNERMCSVSIIAKVLVQMPDGTFEFLPLAEYREEKCQKGDPGAQSLFGTSDYCVRYVPTVKVEKCKSDMRSFIEVLLPIKARYETR